METGGGELFSIQDMSIEEAEVYVREHPPTAMVIGFPLDLVRSKFASQRALENGMRKHAKNYDAKMFVNNHWQKDKGGCNSKSEFARIFAKRVKNEFDVTITPRTIERSWLPKG